MNCERLETVASKVVLGIVSVEELAHVAALALEDGCDSPSLRILAGLSLAEADEARVTFEQALAELNRAVPCKRDAVMRLARETAKGILSGSMDAYEGAKQIWQLSLRIPDYNLPELDPFVYAASEWEDRPTDRHIFDEGIVAAARELLTIPGSAAGVVRRE